MKIIRIDMNAQQSRHKDVPDTQLDAAFEKL